MPSPSPSTGAALARAGRPSCRRRWSVSRSGTPPLSSATWCDCASPLCHSSISPAGSSRSSGACTSSSRPRSRPAAPMGQSGTTSIRSAACCATRPSPSSGGRAYRTALTAAGSAASSKTRCSRADWASTRRRSSAASPPSADSSSTRLARGATTAPRRRAHWATSDSSSTRPPSITCTSYSPAPSSGSSSRCPTRHTRLASLCCLAAQGRRRPTRPLRLRARRRRPRKRRAPLRRRGQVRAAARAAQNAVAAGRACSRLCPGQNASAAATSAAVAWRPSLRTSTRSSGRRCVTCLAQERDAAPRRAGSLRTSSLARPAPARLSSWSSCSCSYWRPTPRRAFSAAPPPTRRPTC
mmetsp:Transcript_9664/g.32176  ORF Transcript_9664/g.32176 Transcript_9664/m.32176 type:complete len:354 (-) Transcript_9664:1741-2802(-)